MVSFIRQGLRMPLRGQASQWITCGRLTVCWVNSMTRFLYCKTSRQTISLKGFVLVASGASPVTNIPDGEHRTMIFQPSSDPLQPSSEPRQQDSEGGLDPQNPLTQSDGAQARAH